MRSIPKNQALQLSLHYLLSDRKKTKMLLIVHPPTPAPETKQRHTLTVNCIAMHSFKAGKLNDGVGSTLLCDAQV